MRLRCAQGGRREPQPRGAVLSNLDVVIAGGSGGLGGECARDLAAAGARVVDSFKQNAARADALSEIAAVLKADLASPEDRALLLDAARNLYGLVVFAGDPARVTDPSRAEEAMLRSHQVNYLGPILLAREAAARMKARNIPGAIVLLSTMQAVSVFEGSTAYAAQKAALIQGAKILAKECRGKTDVRVNVICPNLMQAGMGSLQETEIYVRRPGATKSVRPVDRRPRRGSANQT